jgi:hypothetical protein
MLAAGKRIKTGIGGDAVEPGAKRPTSIEALEAAPGAQIGLLNSVLRFVQRAKHAVAMHPEFATERLRELFKRTV